MDMLLMNYNHLLLHHLKKITTLLLCCCCFSTATASNSLSIHSKDYRFMVDSAIRVNHLESSNSSHQLFLGFDYQYIFKRQQSDNATLILQPMLVKLHNVMQPFNYFSDGDDVDLQWRAAFINYTGLSRGQFNIRAGHIELPFGAEFNAFITGGTLRQLTTNIGQKMDWGISANGQINQFDYEIAYTRGSGNEWDRADGAGIVSGRIAFNHSAKHHWGLSFLHGDLVPAKANQLVEKRRTAIDYLYSHGQLTVRGEISDGEDNGNDRQYGLAEVSRFSNNRDLFWYAQYRYQKNFDPANQIHRSQKDIILGNEWRPHLNTEISTQLRSNVSHKNASNAPAVENSLFQIQVRYRFL